MDHQLVAQYELRRQSFLIGFVQAPKHFSQALAYAYEHRVAPIFNQDIEREAYGADLFDAVYWVKRDFVMDVTKYMDDRWLAKDLESLGFYKLENKFGGYKANRMELIGALEYTRIAGRFDDEVWKAIEAEAPAEANSLAAKFEPKDVHFD